MKKLAAVVLLFALAIAAWWFSGPYLAIHNLSQAIEQRDINRLQRNVDFIKLRASLRQQLGDHLLKQAGADTVSGPFGSLLQGLGQQLGGAAIDTLVTPASIGAMLQGRQVWKRGRAELEGDDGAPAPPPAQPLREAKHHFERLDRFVVDVERGPGEPPLQLVLEPQGLRWKVVDLRLGL